jgi:hypothetical protein
MKKSLFGIFAALLLSVSAPLLADDGDAHKADTAAKAEGKADEHAAPKAAKAKAKGKGKAAAKKADEHKADEGAKH